MVFTVPGLVMEMTPPKAHVQVAGTVRAGFPPMKVVADPGVQGPAVTGVHGIGVSTPSAAAVALATVGFDRLEHIPNGGMPAIGMFSRIVAAGMFSMTTVWFCRTESVEGAAPQLQVIIAPMATFGVPISADPR